MKKYVSAFIILASITCSRAQTHTQLWGMTVIGGQYSAGVIFNTDSVGNNETVQYNFYENDGNPSYSNDLVQASDGKLYGITTHGGLNNAGVIFQYDPVANTYTKKFDFSNAGGSGPACSLMQASDGKLYGTASSGGANNFGVLFQYDPSTNTYTKKFDFDGTAHGGSPNGTLIQATDGKLYGVTYSGGATNNGVIFQYDPVSGSVVNEFDFSGTAAGRWAMGALMQASDGTLYGMTSNGGTNSAGVIFQYDITSNAYSKKFEFDGLANGSFPQGALMQASDGKLYGMTSAGGSNNKGVVFQYDPSTSTYSKKVDLSSTEGIQPYGSLLQASDGKLYGMTSGGGIKNTGVIFKFDITTNIYTKTFDFDGSSNGGTVNGSNPFGSFIQASDGKLYAMTANGGMEGSGTLLQYDPSTGTQVKKIDFKYAIDGENPTGSLMQASDGNLYGMTITGGVYNKGVIFQYNTTTNTYVKKIDLDSAGGCNPGGSLIQASDGKLYGVTQYGGANNNGVIFQYDPGTNTYSKKFDFDENISGYGMYGSLVQASDGKLYGMNAEGGSGGLGVLFQYDPAGNTFTGKYNFSGGIGPGAEPYGSLIQATDGMLYGMASVGGANNSGVIFQYNPVTSSYVKKVDFGTGTNCGSSKGSLFQASDGKLYGMGFGGLNSWGTIFQYDPVSNTLAKEIDLSSASGWFPSGSFMESSDGKLYGMTPIGGANNAGVLFQYDQSTGAYNKKLDFDNINGAGTVSTGQPGYDMNLIAVKSISTGIAKNKAPEKTTVYPNPFASSTTIQSDKILNNASLTVYNSVGQQVNQVEHINGQTVTLPRAGLPCGIYFIRLTEGGQIIANDKVVITDN